jgi:flagellin
MIILNSHGMGRGVQRYAKMATYEQAYSLERMSSGSRLNRAKDDAARLGVSENLDAASRSKRAALRNLEDAMSMTQTAEGGLGEIGNILKRARALAVQSSSEILSATERAYVQDEFAQAMEEVDSIANTSFYNSIPLLAYATVDVGLIVDVSASMLGELTEVKNEIANFVQTLDNAKLQAELGLASMGTDSTDNVTLLADLGSGDFDAELNNLGIFGSVLMDPYATLYQTSGVDDISGVDDPDAFSWRTGTKRKTLVMVTDTLRETSIYSTTKLQTATAMANAEVEVHTINRTIYNGVFDTIATLSGGALHDIGDNTGSGVAQSFQEIADALSDDYGATPLKVQSSHRAGASSLIEINLPVNATKSGLGLTTTSVATVADAQDAIGEIDAALDTVNEHRSTAAAASNQIQQAIDAETRAKSDLDRAGTEIVSADIASEAATAARQQAKAQATKAVRAQAIRLQRRVINSLLNE